MTPGPVDGHGRILAAMVALSFGTVVWWLGAVVLFLVLWRGGMALLRSMTTPLPPPPPPGEMRKVSVRYQCTVCGLELKLLLAPDEDPPPPKHCLEEMVIQAPLYE